MNVDLLVMVIILYILKNNSRQYWYAKNKNQNLLLLLLFINERNQCLNNKYYMSYPNHPLKDSNCIKNTSKDTSINNTKDNIVNIDKGDAMSKNNNTPIDTNKNITKNANKNTVVNKNKSTSNNKNSNRAILKNKFIKTTTKIYNKSNNSRQFRYPQNRNQTLLLLLLLINEKNNDTSIDTNKNNDTIIDTNKDITKNTSKDNSKNKENIINSDKNIIKNTDNDNIINIDNSNISDSSNDNSIDPNKNNNDNVATTINKNKDNLIKSNKTISKNTDKDDIVNEDNSISNDKNSNKANLKNKFIKPITKIHNESSTYKNPCQKNNNISISNTFKQLPLAQINTDISGFIKDFNLKIPAPLTDVKSKVPVLVGSTNITELFHGKVTFCKPIISILKVTNEIFITSKSILATLHTNANNAELHYEGFLKTQLEYLEDVIIEQSQIKCDSKHYIMLIPFSGSKELNFTDEIINSPNIVLSDFDLDINRSTFSVDTCLEETVKGNEYINLYKICNLTVKVDCDVSLYRKKLVQL